VEGFIQRATRTRRLEIVSAGLNSFATILRNGVRPRDTLRFVSVGLGRTGDLQASGPGTTVDQIATGGTRDVRARFVSYPARVHDRIVQAT